MLTPRQTTLEVLSINGLLVNETVWPRGSLVVLAEADLITICERVFRYNLPTPQSIAYTVRPPPEHAAEANIK